jgi:hypothetical protein
MPNSRLESAPIDGERVLDRVDKPVARESSPVARLLSRHDLEALLCEMPVECEYAGCTQPAHQLKARAVDQAQTTTASNK